jgi:hypothetical protein
MHFVTVLAQSNTAEPGCSLADLERKYQLLLSLRGGSEPFDARTLRRLAAEFPGALRELDALPTAELEARAGAVAVASRSASRLEPWMEWMIAYHETMRTALAVRRHLFGKRDAKTTELAAAAAAFTADCDVDFVAAVMNPPKGRLNVLVFARLAARFGCSPETFEQRLFRAEAA